MLIAYASGKIRSTAPLRTRSTPNLTKNRNIMCSPVLLDRSLS